jgi:hypothetical protein
MIDPLAIIKEHDGLVIRIGGNSLTPRHSSEPDYDFLDALLRLVRHYINAERKVTIVVGGVGGHLFTEWARRLNCSDALLNSIGCALMDIGAQILSDFLSRNLSEDKSACCPKSINSIEEMMNYRTFYPAMVCGSGIQGAISSDSLAILVADALKNPILSIKRSIPFKEIILKPAGKSDYFTSFVTVQDVEQLIYNDGLMESAGWHHSLDTWSLRLLRRPTVELSITSVDAVKDFRHTSMLAEVMKIQS